MPMSLQSQSNGSVPELGESSAAAGGDNVPYYYGAYTALIAHPAIQQQQPQQQQQLQQQQHPYANNMYMTFPPPMSFHAAALQAGHSDDLLQQQQLAQHQHQQQHQEQQLHQVNDLEVYSTESAITTTSHLDAASTVTGNVDNSISNDNRGDPSSGDINVTIIDRSAGSKTKRRRTTNNNKTNTGTNSVLHVPSSGSGGGVSSIGRPRKPMVDPERLQQQHRQQILLQHALQSIVPIGNIGCASETRSPAAQSSLGDGKCADGGILVDSGRDNYVDSVETVDTAPDTDDDQPDSFAKKQSSSLTFTESSSSSSLPQSYPDDSIITASSAVDSNHDYHVAEQDLESVTLLTTTDPALRKRLQNRMALRRLRARQAMERASMVEELHASRQANIVLGERCKILGEKVVTLEARQILMLKRCVWVLYVLVFLVTCAS
jgi:hypothetical protein